MKIVLVEKTSDRGVNKDQMGGYGINTHTGRSFFARCIMRQKKRMRNIPVLTLANLAAIFSKDGHEVKILDDENKLSPADLFIIASSIVDCKSELKMAQRIKRMYPKTKIGFIGPFSEFLANEYLKHSDFVIKGEPEYMAIEISKGFIPEGIVESPNLDSLDGLPFPKWELFQVKNYSYSPSINKIPFLTIQASRGCAFGCNYCPYLTYQKKWRPRNVDRVIEEIRYLKNKFSIKGLLFRDPLFTLSKDRCIEISKKIIENNFKIDWACETRVDLLDEGLIDEMHRAGLKAINLGIESPRAELLHKASRKAVDLEYQEKIIRYCEKKGVKVIAFYILGLPDDTASTVKETIQYAKEMNTFVAQFHIFTPFPGTELYKNVKEDIIESDWERFDSFTPVVRHKNMSTDELSKLKEYAFVTYYFRLQYIIKHLKHLLPLWKKITPF